MRYLIIDRAQKATIYAQSAAQAAWLYVRTIPATDLPSGATITVQEAEPGMTHVWELTVIRNRTKRGTDYIQFRDRAADKREREFRAWFRERFQQEAARPGRPGEG